MVKKVRIKAKELIKELGEFGYEYSVSKKDAVERLIDKSEGIELFLINGEAAFFYSNKKLLPTLKLLLKQVGLLPKFVVDMGAVRFVVGGADIMRPGIVTVDSLVSVGAFVVIVDETHGKPLAVCETLFSGEDINFMKKGKVLRNIHYVGDKLWKI